MRIAAAKYIGGYQVQVWFTNGETRIADFNAFLQAATNPMTTKYRDKTFFSQVRAESGALNWNHEMDIPAIDIYRNHFPVIQKHSSTT